MEIRYTIKDVMATKLITFSPETLITATPDTPGPEDKANIVIFNYTNNVYFRICLIIL